MKTWTPLKSNKHSLRSKESPAIGRTSAFSTRRLTTLALLSALALTLSWLEAILPFQPGLPGVKLGLANLVIVCVLYSSGNAAAHVEALTETTSKACMKATANSSVRPDVRSALLVNVVRILLAGLLFSGLFSTIYSLAGALVSLYAMALLLLVNQKREAAGKPAFFSIYGVSMTGGVFHNLGQLLVAILFVSNLNLFYYFPIMILSGIATGIANGIIAELLLQHLPKSVL